MTFGVSIPAYKNVESLRRCLDSIFRCSPDAATSVVVVDDSGSGLVSKSLQDIFPSIRWLLHDTNRGFGASASEAVAANRADIVILLNDDTELLCDPVTVLSTMFQDTTLFAVTFRSLDDHDIFREGAKRLVWKLGYPRVLHNQADQLSPVNGRLPSSYAVGGHSAYHREKFVRLGGFDPFFEPFYWEDVDLSLRAMASGWHSIYSPECTVRHAGGSAIRSINDQRYIKEVTERNRLLFAWRHARGIQVRLLRATIALRRLTARFRDDPIFERAYKNALERQAQYSERAKASFPGAAGGSID